MRRKLFLFTVIIIFAVIAAHYSGIRFTDRFPEALLDKSVSYTGKIIALDKVTKEKTAVKVRLISADGKKIKDNVSMLLTCYDETSEPWKLWQGNIEFTCEAQLPAQARNPRCFDYRLYLLGENIKAVGYVDDFSGLQESDRWFDRIQKKLLELRFRFSKSLPEESRGILMGMIFGDTSMLDEDVYEGFRRNGTAHVLAVSGLHVGILYKWVKKAVGKKQTAFSAAVTATVLVTYCFLSSFSASSMRAAVMIIISMIGAYTDRRYDMLTGASVAALIFTGINPYILFSAGFQMSFIAVCSIAFFIRRIPDKVPGSVAVMLSANIGLIPYQIYVFNWFSFSSFIANVPVVYLVSVTVPLGLVQFLLFCILGENRILELITTAMSDLIVDLNDLLSFGAGGFDMVSPPAWQVLFVYLVMFFLASEQFEIMRLRKEKKRIAFIMILFILFSLFIRHALYQPLSRCDLVFVDVGQGDCIHLSTDSGNGEKNILIDGGGKADYNIGKNTLKPYLLKNGVSHIDLSLATHRHTDHYKGLEELYEEGMSRFPQVGLTAGKLFSISEEVSIETLWPLSLEGDITQDENANCSVFMVYIGNFKILVTGDLDSEGEKRMVAYYEAQNKNGSKLKADILKIGHHGSKTSTCDQLLKAVSPRFAVIQVGKNNYGHPDAKIIEKCHEKGIIVLRNDTHGAVGFSFDKNKIGHYEMIEES